MRRIMRHPIFRVVTFVVGLAMVVAALWYALAGVKWQVIADTPPMDFVMLAGLVVASVVLTGALFWQVNLSFDAKPPVALIRMIELIAASSLLNYLPLRPGLLGRAAYLKARHSMPLRQSVQVLLIVIGLSTVVAMLTVLVGVLPADLRWYGGGGAVVIVSAGTPPIARLLLRRRVTHAWAWIPMRCMELAVAAGRLWLAFAIVGSEIAYWQALIAAAGGFLVSLTGLTPNGLGLREWVVTALATMVSPALTAPAALATVIDRAAEAVVFAVVGLASLAHIGPQLRPSPDEEGQGDLPPEQVRG